MFVLNDVINDDMKYFKWHTASTNVADLHQTHFFTNDKIIKKHYDLFTACTVMCNSNTLLPMRTAE